jgi:hypothetical protein
MADGASVQQAFGPCSQFHADPPIFAFLDDLLQKKKTRTITKTTDIYVFPNRAVTNLVVVITNKYFTAHNTTCMTS